MQKEKSIYADVLESAISWRVRDMYNLYYLRGARRNGPRCCPN